MPIDNTWLDARIAATQALIEAYETAMTTVATNGGSYSLDTGATRQTVTQADLSSMRLQLDMLDNRLAMLCARRNGSSFYARML